MPENAVFGHTPGGGSRAWKFPGNGLPPSSGTRFGHQEASPDNSGHMFKGDPKTVISPEALGNYPSKAP